MSNYIQVKSSEGWDRPSDWLPIPSYGVNEEVIYLLYAVYDTTVNPCAFLCNGIGSGYTVDWGDGTTTNYAFNVKAEHNYVYANLPASSECSRGYRQALIKVTPQAGATITTVNIDQRHTSYNYYMKTAFIEVHINLANLTTYTPLSNIRSTSIEYCKFKKLPNSMVFALKNYQNLQLFDFTDKGTCTNFQEAFANCRALSKIKGDLSLGTNFYGTFSGTSFTEINLNGATISTSTGAYIMFDGVSSLTSLKGINAVSGNIGQFLWAVPIEIIPAIDMTGVTSASNAWGGYQSIRKSLAYGIKVSHSYANQLLDATSLNEIFTNLGTANSGATITITGNPGVATCNQSIATAKGWTVIN